MAKMIPDLNMQTLGRMTSGEERVARCLKALLEDDCLVWYDIPVGKKRRYPDFIILHRSRGLLFLEVKDWRFDTLKKVDHQGVSIKMNQGLVTRRLNPLEQARQCTHAVLRVLEGDPLLCEAAGSHKGNPVMPYG